MILKTTKESFALTSPLYNQYLTQEINFLSDQIDLKKEDEAYLRPKDNYFASINFNSLFYISKDIYLDKNTYSRNDNYINFL